MISPLNHVLAFLFPEFCISCKARGSYLCLSCIKRIHFFDYPLCPACARPLSQLGVHQACKKNTSLDGLYALAHHEGVIKQLISSIKYRKKFDKAKIATSLLYAHMPQSLKEACLIIPVPLHPKRRQERGFNQAETLARSLAYVLSIPSASFLLRRKKHTPSQAQLNRQERLRNVVDAFEIDHFSLNSIKSELKPPYIILLIDDVTTTRSTLQECAKTLKKALPCTVYGVVLAHGK
jgi:competence protein ComFC